MTNYNPNNTPRLKVHYTYPDGAHDMLFRGEATADSATLIGMARDIMTAMAALCRNSWQAESAQFAERGSNLFFPVVWGSAIVGTNTDTTYGVDYPSALSYQFLGRDGNGSNVEWYLYGGQAVVNRKMRINGTDNADVAAIITEFTESALRTVAGDVPVYKQYANLVMNDYIVSINRSS